MLASATRCGLAHNDLVDDIPLEVLERYRRLRCRSVVLEALERVEVPESSRKNVRRPGDLPPRGMCLGMTECWTRGPMPSTVTRRKPIITSLLCEFARHEVPSFQFTSIQVNKDYAAALHTDKNDAGSSMIVGLGSYSGGELWIDDDTPHGKCVNICGKWLQFDGQRAHEVLPFRGRRYTLVYFSRESGGDVGADPTSNVARRLFELGFPLPTSLPATRAGLPSADERIHVAKQKMFRFATRSKNNGGPNRLRLGLRLHGAHCGSNSGALLRMAVDPGKPLAGLLEALSSRMESLGGAVKTEVHLQLNDFVVAPWDTAGGLGLQHNDTIDVIGLPAEAALALTTGKKSITTAAQ